MKTSPHHVKYKAPDGTIQDGVTVAGMLLMMLDGDPAQAAPPFDRIIPRYRERALVLLAAETRKPLPREAGEVLYEAFNGRQLDEAIAEACRPGGDSHAFERVLLATMKFVDEPRS